MDDIQFLSVQDVLDIHANTLREQGGGAGIRDLGLLESAVAMPRQSFGGEYVHEGLAAMSAAYFFHLCQNHLFVDGNKRVGVSSAFVFLVANGVAVAHLPEPDEVERVTLSVASGELSKEELAEWLEARLGAI